MPYRDSCGHYAEKYHLEGYVRLKKEEIDADGMNRLVQAIVHKAAFDYKHGKDFWKDDAKCFFKSDWFTALTGLDGDYMLRQLDKYELANFEEVVKNAGD